MCFIHNVTTFYVLRFLLGGHADGQVIEVILPGQWPEYRFMYVNDRVGCPRRGRCQWRLVRMQA